MKTTFLIVAGGSGTRMMSDIPKQFLLLAGKPLLMHTLEVFYNFSPSTEILLVLADSHFSHWQNLCMEYNFSIPHKLIKGGDTRFESVKNGLSHIEPPGWVAIHDGARPLLSLDLLRHVLETAKEKGNAIPVLPLVESMRKIEGEQNRPVSREEFVTIQTPQVFDVAELLLAYQNDFQPDFTDDATVLESLGKKIHLVEGEITNIKITSAIDLLVAENILKGKSKK